jgi:sulfur relay (sulfurtransferase) complex TusBCD TusD component (DsrE family)
MPARGVTEDMLTMGTRRSTLDKFATWTLWVENVVSF